MSRAGKSIGKRRARIGGKVTVLEAGVLENGVTLQGFAKRNRECSDSVKDNKVWSRGEPGKENWNTEWSSGIDQG
jgi:hypothetical protein